MTKRVNIWDVRIKTVLQAIDDGSLDQHLTAIMVHAERRARMKPLDNVNPDPRSKLQAAYVSDGTVNHVPKFADAKLGEEAPKGTFRYRDGYYKRSLLMNEKVRLSAMTRPIGLIGLVVTVTGLGRAKVQVKVPDPSTVHTVDGEHVYLSYDCLNGILEE